MQTAAAESCASPASSGATRVSLFIMAVAAFALVTTEFLILGILPPVARDLNISIPMAGQLVTLFAFTVMICGPFATALVNHVERKKLFLLILGIFAVSNALSAMATSYWMLAVARVLAAIALPVFWGTASEAAAQLAGPRKEGKAVSQVYLGITAAFVFGIPLGTLASSLLGWRGSFWLLAGMCVLVGALMLIFIPQIRPKQQAASPLKQMGILKDGRFIAHVLLSTVVFTAMFTAYTYLADTLERVAHLPTNDIGWWLMGFGIIGMLGNYVGGRLADRSTLIATVVLLVVLSLGMTATAPAASSITWLVVALALWGIAYTALFPVCQVRVMQAAPQAQALAGTMNVSAANGGIGLGAAAGGLVIQHVGLPYTGYVASAIAVVASAISLALKK